MGAPAADAGRRREHAPPRVCAAPAARTAPWVGFRGHTAPCGAPSRRAGTCSSSRCWPCTGRSAWSGGTWRSIRRSEPWLGLGLGLLSGLGLGLGLGLGIGLGLRPHEQRAQVHQLIADARVGRHGPAGRRQGAWVARVRRGGAGGVRESVTRGCGVHLCEELASSRAVASGLRAKALLRTQRRVFVVSL
eukprot:scaffold11555_cov63-Phaeocystis_antarctica.AAC.1